jgi:hypothetical protein
MTPTDQAPYAPTGLRLMRFAVAAGSGDRQALTEQIKPAGLVRVLARGANVQVKFGDVDDTIPTMDSTTNTDGTVGYHIANGSYHDFYLNGVHTHLLWDADASGFIDVYRAGVERVRTGT